MDIPDLRELVPVPKEVKFAAEHGRLILFVGSGVSIRMKLPSWKQFAMRVLDDLVASDTINYKHVHSLKKLKPREILSIAKNYDQNLDCRNYFQPNDKATSRIYVSLNELGCTFVTTNYDLYLRPASPRSSADGSKTENEGIRITTREELLPLVLGQVGNVAHLHGSVEVAESMIITTKQYLKHYDNENVQTFLRCLFEKMTVVFLGYGLEESELLEHILRRGSVKAMSKPPKLFSLQGFFSTEIPLYESLYEYYKRSFDLELLGFLKDYQGYVCLDEIVRHWVDEIEVKSSSMLNHIDAVDAVFGQ